MASNLVSYLMQSLTPDVIARLAAALGLDTDKVQRGVAAAVPALLAGLANVVAQPGGAEKVADAARQQGAVADPGAMLSAGNQSSLAQTGSQMLASLLGGNTSGSLANAIGSYSGLGQNAAGSLLGMLAPLVMGGLARRLGGDVSANGVANLLAAERENIVAALPSGMSDMLRGSGLFEGAAGAARTATAGSDTVARTAAPASGVRDTTTTTSSGRGSSWLYWLIAALVVLGALYYWFGRPAHRAAPPAPPATETPAPATPKAPAEPQSQAPSGTQPAAPSETPTQNAPATPAPPPETPTQAAPATPAAPSLTVAGVDMGKQVSDAMANIETTLNGVKDAASAQAAVPKVQAASDQLDKVSGMLGQLSPEQKTALADLVRPRMASLNALFDRILAMPGVSDVLKPAIDGLRTKLTALAP